MDEDAEDVFAAAPSSDSMMQGQAPTSNLASIVQLMKQSISNSQDHPPSSSSPLPETGHATAAFPESPLKRHSPRVVDEDGTSDTLQAGNAVAEDDFDDLLAEDHDLPYAPNEHQQVDQRAQSSPSSDDFGDVDFDTDMADVTNAGTLATEQSAASETNRQLPPEPAPAVSAAVLNVAESEDEFGIEDDEDEFAADLEQVASLFDNRPLESPSPETLPAETPVVNAAPIMDLANDDSDDFGDDIDPDEFAAAEVAATQTSATNTVCRRNTHNETV